MMGTWLLTLVLALEPVWGPEESIPVQASREGSGLASFDTEITDWMRRHQVPGAALAVGKDGNLVLARGYGFADHGARQPVQPDSLFRVASVSKPLTGIAVLRLLETGPVDASGAPVTLDTPVMRVLDCEPFLPDGQAVDPRWDQVTLRHLLHHTGGWDRDESFDPMLPPFSIAERMGIAPPAGPRDVVRYMLGQPLDFDPGTRHVYSNFGYCLLGRVIEALSGLSYEEYVRREVLAPLGIEAMSVGASLEEGRAPGEVRYYHDGRAPNVFHLPYDREKGLVPHAYGGFALEPMDAHGGWVASAPDLVRLAMAFDDPDGCPVLSAGSVRLMFARPDGPAGYDDEGTPKDAYYAMGWMVRPRVEEIGQPDEGMPGHANHWHAGRLPGTSSLLVRRRDGLTWAVVANRGYGPEGETLGDIDGMLHKAANAVEEWPEPLP